MPRTPLYGANCTTAGCFTTILLSRTNATGLTAPGRAKGVTLPGPERDPPPATRKTNRTSVTAPDWWKNSSLGRVKEPRTISFESSVSDKFLPRHFSFPNEFAPRQFNLLSQAKVRIIRTTGTGWGGTPSTGTGWRGISSIGIAWRRISSIGTAWGGPMRKYSKIIDYCTHSFDL